MKFFILKDPGDTYDQVADIVSLLRQEKPVSKIYLVSDFENDWKVAISLGLNGVINPFDIKFQGQ